MPKLRKKAAATSQYSLHRNLGKLSLKVMDYSKYIWSFVAANKIPTTELSPTLQEC